MILKKPGIIPYTEKQFITYQKRLAANLISHHALNCEQVAIDTEAKNYIANIVKGFQDSESALNQLRKSIRFAHMEIDDGYLKKTLYPIIHIYNGHYIEKSVFFYKKNMEYGYIEVPVIEKPTIIGLH